MNANTHYEVTVTLKPRSLKRPFRDIPTRNETEEVAWKIIRSILFDLRHEIDLSKLFDVDLNMVISRDTPVGLSCHSTPVEFDPEE